MSETIPAVPALEPTSTEHVAVWLAANHCSMRSLGGEREPLVGIYSKPDEEDGAQSVRFILTPEAAEELSRRLKRIAKAARGRR